MNDSIVLLSKDILMPGYLPTYGNKFWKTPNIDELAAKGTVFYRHYTAAPSTAMAFTSMFTKKYPYQLDRRNYIHVDDLSDTETLFDELEKQGYENHVVWSKNYLTVALPFSNCYGSDKTIFHNLDLNQVVGPHFNHDANIVRNDETARKTVDSILTTIDEVANRNGKVFLWIHLPHVLLGRTSYGDDMDLFDDIVEHLRHKFGDENIFITADHGNMNGIRGKFGYGFDVYESAIRIPLITPKLENVKNVEFPTSNCRLRDIMINRVVPKDEYVISDCAYYAQPNRKLAIIKDDFKYIYNKASQTEELYDLVYDPNETVNLISKNHFDTDRRVSYHKCDIYFYPRWNQVDSVYIQLKRIKDEIWRVGTWKEEVLSRWKQKLSIPYHKIQRRIALIKEKR
ncbi:MAG: sulfatase-like hydrolase/transferase [Eubacteriales bacterium]|nr:sulfatase-like hydrolase/transferase [Eubacteriales bacterium]